MQFDRKFCRGIRTPMYSRRIVYKQSRLNRFPSQRNNDVGLHRPSLNLSSFLCRFDLVSYPFFDRSPVVCFLYQLLVSIPVYFGSPVILLPISNLTISSLMSYTPVCRHIFLFLSHISNNNSQPRSLYFSLYNPQFIC